MYKIYIFLSISLNLQLTTCSNTSGLFNWLSNFCLGTLHKVEGHHAYPSMYVVYQQLLTEQPKVLFLNPIGVTADIHYIII